MYRREGRSLLWILADSEAAQAYPVLYGHLYLQGGQAYWPSAFNHLSKWDWCPAFALDGEHQVEENVQRVPW